MNLLRTSLSLLLLAVAIALSTVCFRQAWASALLFTPDVPNPALPSVTESRLERARRLAPSNAIYRYWQADHRWARFRARYLAGPEGYAVGLAALDEADAAARMLPVNPYFLVQRARIALELARHPATGESPRATLEQAAADDLARAIELRGQSPMLVIEAVDTVVPHWHRLRRVRPELPLEIFRLSVVRDRLGTEDRLLDLWRVLSSGGLTIEEAIATMEMAVPENYWPSRLRRAFGRIAPAPRYPGVDRERARGLLEEARDRARNPGSRPAREGVGEERGIP